MCKPEIGSSGSLRAIVASHALLAPLVVWPFGTDAFELPKELMLRAVACAIAGAALAGVSRRSATRTSDAEPRGAKSRLRALDAASIAALAWLAAGALAAWRGVSLRASLLGAHDSFDGLIAQAGYVTLFFAARAALALPDVSRRRLFDASLAAAGLASAYALLQLAGLDPVRWRRTAELDGHLRVFATLGHPNHLGSYLAMVVPFALLRVRDARRAGRPGTALASALVVVLAAPAILATLSRSAWIGAAAGLAVFLALVSRFEVRGTTRRLGIAVAVGAALGFALLAAPIPLADALRTRIAGTHPSREARVPLWRAAARMAADRPLTGVGPDAFGLAFGRYRTLAYERLEGPDLLPVRAHSEPLHVAATYGGLGLAVAALGVIGTLRNARRGWRRHPSTEGREGIAALVAALAAFGASTLLGFHVVATASLASLAAGALAGLAGSGEAAPGGSHDAGSRSSARRAAEFASWLAAGAAIVVLVVAPLAAQVFAWRGTTLASVGHLDLGRASFARAVRLAPSDDRMWAFLGAARQREAQLSLAPAVSRSLLAEAQEALERATALEPNDPDHWLRLATLLLERDGLEPPEGDRAAALAALDAAVALEPRSGARLATAHELALALGDEERAARFFAQRQRLTEP
jgi:O-antigen ligase